MDCADSSLEENKHLFPESMEDPDMERFCYTIDGVDCGTREIQHPSFNIDTKACSHKLNHCAAKYERVISVHHARCCSINGPYKRGVHDLTMFRSGKLKEHLKKMDWARKQLLMEDIKAKQLKTRRFFVLSR
eukprot:1744089-Ditylum_brightwellii.AAC.1